VFHRELLCRQGKSATVPISVHIRVFLGAVARMHFGLLESMIELQMFTSAAGVKACEFMTPTAGLAVNNF
jgi:hypothetical protein